ncbi:MAG: SGNH/GDSL hydrolase family protein [Candidatus Eiseniibacteriota bacterium]
MRAHPLLAGSLAAAALPLLAWVDAVAALARGWLPLGNGRALLPVLSALLVLAGATLLFPAVRSLLRSRAPSIAVVSGSVLVALLVAEAALAPVFPVPVREQLYHLRTPLDVREHRPDPRIMPGVHGPSRYGVNSLGVRGDEPRSGDFLVLCVGGSTTECLYLDDAESWPRLLQDQLREAHSGRRAWVGNAGFSGYTTAEHLEFLENSPLIERMDCVVLLAGLNDFLRFVGGGEFTGKFFHPRMRIRPLLLGSNLANLVAGVRQRIEARSRAGIDVEDAGGESYVQRRALRAQAPAGELPDLSGALVGFEVRLDRIVSACRARGIRLVLVTHPALWDEALPAAETALLWMGETPEGAFVPAGELRRGLEEYNRVILSVSRRTGASCVDLADLSGDARWFYDDCHFNEAGAALVARRLVPALGGDGW